MHAKLLIQALFVFFILTPVKSQINILLEAENAVIAGSHTMKNGGEYASNGEWVILKKASSNAGSATFQVEDIQEGGNYYLKVFHFNNNKAQTAFLEVNGQSNSINLILPVGSTKEFR